MQNISILSRELNNLFNYKLEDFKIFLQEINKDLNFIFEELWDNSNWIKLIEKLGKFENILSEFDKQNLKKSDLEKKQFILNKQNINHFFICAEIDELIKIISEFLISEKVAEIREFYKMAKDDFEKIKNHDLDALLKNIKDEEEKDDKLAQLLEKTNLKKEYETKIQKINNLEKLLNKIQKLRENFIKNEEKTKQLNIQNETKQSVSEIIIPNKVIKKSENLLKNLETKEKIIIIKSFEQESDYLFNTWKFDDWINFLINSKDEKNTDFFRLSILKNIVNNEKISWELKIKLLNSIKEKEIWINNLDSFFELTILLEKKSKKIENNDFSKDVEKFWQNLDEANKILDETNKKNIIELFNQIDEWIYKEFSWDKKGELQKLIYWINYLGAKFLVFVMDKVKYFINSWIKEKQIFWEKILNYICKYIHLDKIISYLEAHSTDLWFQNSLILFIRIEEKSRFLDFLDFSKKLYNYITNELEKYNSLEDLKFLNLKEKELEILEKIKISNFIRFLKK